MPMEHTQMPESMGKKGSRISGTTEMVVLVIAVVFAFTAIIADMNYEYGQSNALPFSNETNDYISNLTSYSKTARDQIAGGSATEIAGVGILPSTYWGVLKASFLMLFDIISGNWIPMALSYAFYGSTVAVIVGILFQTLFIIGMGYAILRFFSKVTP